MFISIDRMEIGRQQGVSGEIIDFQTYTPRRGVTLGLTQAPTPHQGLDAVP